MNIVKYADILNLNIVITYYHNQNNRWSARFEHVETKEHAGTAILRSEYGSGSSATDAINNYLDLIEGKIIVVNAMTDKRREYLVPKIERMDNV